MVCTGLFALNHLPWKSRGDLSRTEDILDTQKKLIENLKKICMCRSVNLGTIKGAMREGALSFEALRRKISVGTGNCKAKRCRPRIEKLVREHKEDLPEGGNGRHK
jgi:bacterioferritin-associated ferredoxin